MTCLFRGFSAAAVAMILIAYSAAGLATEPPTNAPASADSSSPANVPTPADAPAPAEPALSPPAPGGAPTTTAGVPAPGPALSPAPAPVHPGYPPPVPAYPPPGSVTDKGVRASDPAQSKKRRSAFYMQLALGPGFLGATTESSADTRTFSGSGVALQAMFGASIDRVAIAGGYSGDRGLTLSASDELIDGDEPDLTDYAISLDVFGAFLKLLPPDEDSGFEGQVFVGLGDLNVHGPDRDDVDDPSGAAMGLGAGYNFRLNEQVSLAALARFSGGFFSVRETGNSLGVTVYSGSLLMGLSVN